MNTQLKAEIEAAIDSVIQRNCEDPPWEGMVHPELVQQMTSAAEQVFDAAMKAQAHYCHETFVTE